MIRPGTIPLFTALLCLFTLTACKPARAHIFRVADRQTITLSELLTDLREAKIIFHGEIHDNRSHHLSQLQLIKALHERGEKLAIGLEMLPSERQDTLDEWIAGEITTDEFRQIFNSYWGLWDLYKEIFIHARQKNIPMIALNLPREITKKVARRGFDSLKREELARIPKVSCIISKEYEKFIRKALGAHAGHNGNFTNFCEAQLLWDKVMARNLMNFLERNDSATVFVMAGGGHSWKRGIPSHIQTESDIPYRVLLPEISERWMPDGIDSGDADYLLRGLEHGELH